jgi:hypothetical protein
MSTKDDMNQPHSAEETIFEAARHLGEPEKQAAYLDLACGGDGDLRERIERLLRAGIRARDFFKKNNPARRPSSAEAAMSDTITESQQQMSQETTLEESFIKISCPACDQHIEIPSELTEQPVVCPTCNQGFITAKGSNPKKPGQPRWTTGPIVIGIAVLCFFGSGFVLGRLVLKAASVSPTLGFVTSTTVFLLSPLLFVYGLAHLIVCLVARKKAGVRIGVWKIKTSLASLAGTLCMVGVLIWGGAKAWNELNDTSPYRMPNYIHRSDEREVPKFETAEQGIKSKLVSPSSAKFETIAEFTSDDQDDSSASMRLEVDSQNKYGAMIHSKWQVRLHRYKDSGREWWSYGNVKMIETSEE